MKLSLVCGAVLFSAASFAFPTSLLKGDISDDALAEITALAAKISHEAEAKLQFGHVKRAFNASSQCVSTTGEHAYVCYLLGRLVRHIADQIFDRLRQVPMTFVAPARV